MRKFDANPPRITLAMVASLALAACNQAQEEKTYEAAVEDESGGELIVRDVDPDEVPVDIPDVEMTNVPAAEEGQEPETE